MRKIRKESMKKNLMLSFPKKSLLQDLFYLTCVFITPQRSVCFFSALSSLRMRLIHYNILVNVLWIHGRQIAFYNNKIEKEGGGGCCLY